MFKVPHNLFTTGELREVVLGVKRENNGRVIQPIFPILLALALALPANSCQKQKRVSDKTNRSVPQSENSATSSAPRPLDVRLPEGKWGGQHVRLDVTATGANIEFDCGHGTLSGPLILREGRFAVSGTYVREGGPVRLDGTGKSQPAHFKGQVEGAQMNLTFSLAADETTAETFKLTRGAEARLFKCK